MDPVMWRTVRWFVALGACAVVVLVAIPMTFDALSASIVFGDDVEPDEADDEADDEEGADPAAVPGEVPRGPVADGDAAAEADFVVRDGVVRQSSADRLTLTRSGDLAVAVFPLVDGDPECVASAQLEMQLEEADATEVAVYAASLHAAMENGDEVDDPRLDDTPRALALTDGSPGRLLWDVTDLYRAWTSGELAPPGTPFVVVLQVREESADVTFTSVEAGRRDAPALVWAGEPDCGGNV